MADFEKDLSLEDALTDNPPEVEEEIKRDFISTLEAEPYDDVIGETCGKCDYIPLLDDDAEKSGNHEHQNKPKIDGNHVEPAAASQPAVLENGDREIEENFMTESSRVSMGEEKMYSEFRTQKEPWQLETEHCFEPQPVFQPVQQSVPLESNKDHDLLSELLLLPSSETKSRPAFTEHFGASGDLPAFTKNEAFRDDWLGDGQVRAEEAEDLEYFAKQEGSPGEVLHEHSPWEATSFPVESAKDDHTGSHWQPTIREQQVLGMHHPSVPLDSSETLDKNGNIPSAPTFDEAGVPETNVAGDKEFFPKHDLLKESRSESKEIDQATALVAVEMADDDILLKHISKPQQELQEVSSEPTEIVEDKEIESESLDAHAGAIQAASDISEGDYLPEQNPSIVCVPDVLGFEVVTLPLEIVIPKDASLQQKNLNEESIPEGSGFEAVAVPRRTEDKTLRHPDSNKESVLEFLGFEETSVSQDESWPVENLNKECVPEVLGLVAGNISLEMKIPEDKSLLQHNSNKESIADVLGVDEEAISLRVEESLSQHNSDKESAREVCGINADSVLVKTEQLSKFNQEHHEEAMEIEKHKERKPEELTFGEEAVNEIADEEAGVKTFDTHTVSLGMEYKSSAQQRSCIVEGLGLDAATPSLGLKEESSQYQNDVSDRVFDVIVRNEPLPYQNLELLQQYKGPADDVEQKRTIPGVLPLDTTTLHVDNAVPKNKIQSQLESETHQERPTAEPLAPALTHGQQELLSEAPSTNAFNIPSSMELQEASPYLGPQFDSLVAPADVVTESDVNFFTEARAPADGACTVEEEKRTAAPCPFLHSEPGTLLQSADGILDELKASVPEAQAPATVSVLEDHKSESSDQHTEEPVLETSVNLEASSAAEAIAGSISAPPSKELPPSPEKKVKASAVAASAKPATAKGRPASTTSPKQSTPPPGKKASSPAPVASSTPKRPASSSARPSNLTPKDSTTPRSSTLTPKEMKPKGLDLKSPIKSAEKKTPVSKASTTVTPRAAVKPATGTPKAAMVPAVAVASTTGSAPKNTSSTTPRRPTTIKADAKPVEAKKATMTAKSADLSRPKTAPVNTGKSNATTPSSPGTNFGPAAPINRPKPSKSVMTKPIPESNATTDGKKVPVARAPTSKVNVAPKAARPGSVPAPDLKNVRSKIGSTDNLKYQPGGGKAKVEKRPESAGAIRKPSAPLPVTRTATTKTTVSKETAQKDSNGRVAKSAPSKKVQPVNAPKCRPGSANVQILNKKVDPSKVTAKCGSKVNIKHKPGGGDVKIENHQSSVKDKVQSKVESLDNMGHAPAGGKVKSEGSENAGDMVQTPQNEDLSTPQGLAGSEMQQNDVPAEGSDQRETQNFDNQIQETSI
ncbi:hypothetical protein NDU88_003949 [Pleurodeles waltl]|uniref:Microtubule-associated protein n=1 Tax=Pleurodeles waltl TaxID=8319 RepID=A0AAV7M5R6_PLEWA|nr:hypothetical protein NDU88_003949 [Pleurodeles waltl]